jgi:glycosyltransferase involved in cell wall biosynthesis
VAAAILPEYSPCVKFGRAITQQTAPPFEVVVVDDESPDGSMARLQSLAAELPWLRFLRPGHRQGRRGCGWELHS